MEIWDVSSSAYKLLPRGVHPADHLVGDCPVLLAIDSRGNCLRRVRLAPDIDEEVAREWLAGLIDHYDPLPRRPQLEVHRGGHTATRIPRATFLALIRR